jgi:Cu+-exporting ATPase
MEAVKTKIRLKCYHCGDDCPTGKIMLEDKHFCCEGCKTVYHLLSENKLCNYYSFDAASGIRPEAWANDKWDFLDNETIQKELLQFTSRGLGIITLSIPGMHCTSCIFLLENLAAIQAGIFQTQVQFLKKELTIRFNPSVTSLRSIVELLSRLGYTPAIHLNDSEKKVKSKTEKSLTYRIAIAGFCFGNIMLFSLPEYFDWKNLLTSDFSSMFRWLGAVFTLPVISYCAWPYFSSALKTLRWKQMNMDLPIALGLFGLAFQSYYNVILNTGPGFFDSLSGLVFFLLLGKFFQQRTYEALSFDRDYKSYFPLAVQRVKNGLIENIKVTQLKPNDLMLIHNNELIPADSILESAEAVIDYSFVTGESAPEQLPFDSTVYAGGRNKGSLIRLRVIQEVSQGYLTKLWNADIFTKSQKRQWGRWAKRSAGIFTVLVISIALITGIYWYFNNPPIAMQAVTAVLIVACPCVLALSIPFTFGAFTRTFGRNGLYLKNSESLESLASIDTIVFDKTGTLTTNGEYELSGKISKADWQLVRQAAASSVHPLCCAIAGYDPGTELSLWKESPGKGIETEINGRSIRIGKNAFVSGSESCQAEGTYISIDGQTAGRLVFRHAYRKDLDVLISSLRSRFQVILLSGDNDNDRELLQSYFADKNMHFGQSPQDKMQFINDLKEKGSHVLMIGDGLNDSGALRLSEFGITITGDINAFTPAADAILDKKSLDKMPAFVQYASKVKITLNLAFLFSGIYNVIGLSFAIQGALLPWIAAVLMPVSSITVVAYTQLLSAWYARKLKL